MFQQIIWIVGAGAQWRIVCEACLRRTMAAPCFVGARVAETFGQCARDVCLNRERPKLLVTRRHGRAPTRQPNVNGRILPERGGINHGAACRCPAIDALLSPVHPPTHPLFPCPSLAASMARSSCSSSRAESGSAQRRRAGTPVKYRKAPYDYSPEMRCDCGEKMPRWISWTDENTAGQFSNCPIKSGRKGIGCEKFKWIELPLTGFHKELVQDLRDAVWDKNDRIRDLEEEVRKLREEQEDKGQRGSWQAQLKKQEAEKEDLKIRPDGTDNLLVIWALSVAFAVYVGIVLSSS